MRTNVHVKYLKPGTNGMNYATGYHERQEFIKTYSWAAFSNEETQLLARLLKRHNKIVDPIAGRGYLARLMRMHGVKLSAYDVKLGYYSIGNKTKYHTAVTRKAVGRVNIKSYAAVLIVWPPYGESVGYDIVRDVPIGGYVYYKGEGNGGCTGDDDMHDLLFGKSFIKDEEASDELNEVNAQWDGMWDRWYVYKRVA